MSSGDLYRKYQAVHDLAVAFVHGTASREALTFAVHDEEVAREMEER